MEVFFWGGYEKTGPYSPPQKNVKEEKDLFSPEIQVRVKERKNGEKHDFPDLKSRKRDPLFNPPGKNTAVKEGST